MTEINKMVTQELVKPFMSSCPVEPETLKETYRLLNESADEKGKRVCTGATDFSTAMAEFLPILDQMQSLLSQRGEAREMLREAKLPLWSDWLRAFRKRSGLDVSVRTLYNHLSKYRSTGKEKRKRSDSPARPSAKVQRSILTALQIANEMVDAFENGGNYLHALQEYKRVAIGPDRIGQLLENTARDAEVTFGSPTALPSTAWAPVVASASPAPFPGAVQPLMRLPKAGDWSGLVDLVNTSCGAQIDATFDGLSPETMADALGKIMAKLANRHCRYDRAAGEIEVNVRYIQSRGPALEEAE